MGQWSDIDAMVHVLLSIDNETSVDLWPDIIAMEYPSIHPSLVI